MLYDLETWLCPVWRGNEAYFETATVVGENGEIRLAFEPIGQVTVYNSTLEKTYLEGVDFTVSGRVLRRLPNGSLPYFALDEFYLPEKCTIDIRAVKGACPEFNAERPFLYFGERNLVTKNQIAVSYKHTGGWTGKIPADKSAKFPKFLKKLQNGENVKITFYGDSITVGANASGTKFGGEISPYTDTFAVMTTKYLEKRYGISVDVVNTAVGGWDSTKGLENFDERALDRQADLLILGFGMNDIWNSVERYAENMQEMISRFYQKHPDGELLLLSSMLPNVESSWGNELTSVFEFEKILLSLEEKYPLAVADLTQMHADLLLAGKRYRDMTGNNINHPNDYLIRVYAQVILKTLIGKDE